jgi:hypothetical protein
MDELIKTFSYQGGQGDQLHVLESLVALTLSFLCSWCISQIYRLTHRGTGYSQSYNQSLILLGMVTTLIMIVIGSNIARAFSLVGALSIIRFRNAVKETRDVAFIFFIMAIAMACGTRFYTLALVATLVNCLAVYLMHISGFGQLAGAPERMVRVQLPPGQDATTSLEPVFPQLFESWDMVSMETVRQGLFTELVYSVKPLATVSAAKVLDALSRVNGNLKVAYSFSRATDEL